MGFSVCIYHPNESYMQNLWDFVLTHYPAQTIYVVGDKNTFSHNNILKNSIWINNLSELPEILPVLICPKEGRFIQGEIDLSQYEHKDDSIYIFGPDHHNLSEKDISFEIQDKVYIKTDSHHEMYAVIAAAITLYDRSVQYG